MRSFEEILQRAAAMGPKRIAIAGAMDEALKDAFDDAKRRGVAHTVEFTNPLSAARAVREGEADVLMKGKVDTKAFMGAVLDKENGLRSGKLISHAFVFEAFGRLMIITDGGIVLNPTLEEKAEIVRNVLPIARKLGIGEPRIAVVTAYEKENPKMPETVDAAQLAAMNIEGCVVEGPLAVDVAMSKEAAAAKGVEGQVPGNVDIFLAPSVLVGNILAKGIMYFTGCSGGGVVAGTSRPVTFLSRSDTAQTKLHTIALGVLMSE
ncbi:phosphate butyryltransferase [bacterium]|nr:phosphate butyryltransferase [bacterium]